MTVFAKDIIINALLRESTVIAQLLFKFSGDAPFLAILLAFSSDAASVRTSVYMLFSQVLPVLLAITASIGNSSLTLFDVKYGISLTASPVSIYVSYSAARELLGIHNSLFERLGHTRHARTTDSSDGEVL